ncbi:hypothetical protein [Mycobacterium celatum]|uniref:Uncharacterized protein n=1 Tax=Mycobacterium celatum TaxID=28045 RepID=A0A1X1RH76_MYCCE|nr:hypothetical protein [Mycobacterium celatum]ORV05655.1 hypothetical protein AWB95_00395 [Mycobacterium celatum]PIB74498.1 hypothetical protein CQY23_21545 [Mycobacterium celatum]
MDLDRIAHPLRLAKGSHQSGSGKGCAMNVISYINGDTQVTDFPACSARPLAALVQCCNDLLAGPDGYLSPEHSVLALDLGWQTVGTADVADTVIHAWVAELLTNPTWGVIGYAKITAIKAITDIAELHRRTAWEAAERAARSAAHAIGPTSNAAAAQAVQAAYESTALIDTHRQAALRAVTGASPAGPFAGHRGQQDNAHCRTHPPCHPLVASSGRARQRRRHQLDSTPQDPAPRRGTRHEFLPPQPC